MALQGEIPTVEAYVDRFGADGDFDRFRLGTKVNLRLMRRALERDSPVTEEDLLEAEGIEGTGGRENLPNEAVQ